MSHREAQLTDGVPTSHAICMLGFRCFVSLPGWCRPQVVRHHHRQAPGRVPGRRAHQGQGLGLPVRHRACATGKQGQASSATAINHAAIHEVIQEWSCLGNLGATLRRQAHAALYCSDCTLIAGRLRVLLAVPWRRQASLAGCGLCLTAHMPAHACVPVSMCVCMYTCAGPADGGACSAGVHLQRRAGGGARVAAQVVR